MKNYFAVAYTAICPLIFGFLGKPTEMGLSAVTGCLLLAFLNLEKFESFKGAGFEAKLKQAVVDAYATIEKLQKLAASLAEPIVMSITMENRLMQYISMQGKILQIKEIEDSLLKIGVSEEDAKKATSFFFDVIKDDHIKRILYQIPKEEGAPENFKESAKGLQESRPDEFDIHDFIRGSQWTPNGETAQLLSDLEYFQTKRKFRRIEKWQ